MWLALAAASSVAAFRSELLRQPDHSKAGLRFESRANLRSGAATEEPIEGPDEPGARILEPGSSKVWYIHIAKSGGMSARQDLPNHLRPLAGAARSGTSTSPRAVVCPHVKTF